ncbi:hypothetical protein GH714_001259 [Hevea brasiliensis]|uniref:Uncharacterized protein n=1 Tax=Hevea brasiliensis TaxID=3981 RepID=A0A6A6MWI9_HEVBR|nr:hypothetical protein GH714_001259 [Hevea brasiliensis]
MPIAMFDGKRLLNLEESVRDNVFDVGEIVADIGVETNATVRNANVNEDDARVENVDVGVQKEAIVGGVDKGKEDVGVKNVNVDIEIEENQL